MAQFNYWPRYGPENYTFRLSAEEKFDPVASTEWMLKYWSYSIVISVFYIIAIYMGQKYMASRKPFMLDNALFWWNLGLAIFSISGTIRLAPEIFWAVNSNSLVYSICNASYAQGLIDTAFIILRKRPLIFLHWYHHVTVLIYTWFAYKDHTASGRWFIFMNFLVHAFMYSYYAVRALKVRIPKWIAMFITVLQIMQMVIGVTIGVATYYLKSNGVRCQHKWTNLYFSFLIYFSYFLLFCNFFYHAYLKRNNRYLKAASSITKNGHANDKNAKLLNHDVTHAINGIRNRDDASKNQIDINTEESNSSSTESLTKTTKNTKKVRKSVTETNPRRSSPPHTRSRQVSRFE